MRGRRHKLQVSTFPFLAVLLCAMGSLILVLLVMDRKAHRAAQARAQQEAARLVEERAHSEAASQVERERLEQQARKSWEQKRDALHDKLTREQIEMQLQMRKVREQMQEIAARLHYEQDMSTQLRGKVQGERDRLRAEEQLLRTLRSRSQQTANQSKESNQTLRRMTLDVLQMEQALKDLKAARQREQKTFSVVPYHGRRGENRRPLYIECTADGVVFHPEHKAMSIVSMLSGSSDPSSDVRAEVERRIARQRTRLAGLPANVNKTPYLLLLLRPAGVNTYHLFQKALKDLPIDFGYEFIDDDWVLDFPADDEQPSTQPWMMATKAPSASSPVASNASTPPRTSDHPGAAVPAGVPMGIFEGGIPVFRVGGPGRGGVWVKGGPTGGVPGGTGPSMPGSVSGNGGSYASAQGLPGRGGGGGGDGTGGSGYPGGNLAGRAGGSSASPSGASSSPALPTALVQGGGVGSQSPSSVSGAGGGSGGGIGVGGGHENVPGYLAPLAPSFRDGGGGTSVSGDGPPVRAGPGGPGAFSLEGSGTGQGSGYAMGGHSGAGGSGSPGTTGSGSSGAGGSGPYSAGGSGSPGLGPPRALPFAQGTGYAGNGTGQGGASGTGLSASGIPGNGAPGNGVSGNGVPGNGVAGSGVPGNGGSGNGVPGNGMPGGSPSGSARPGSGTGTGTSAGGQDVIAQANISGGDSGQGSNLSGGGTGTGNSTIPGAPGGGGGTYPGNQVGNGANLTMQSAGGAASASPINNGSNPSPQGSGGSSPGTQPGMGGSPGPQTPGGNAAPANGGRSSDVVIYVDPLTGKPTAPPRSAAQPADASTQDPPPEPDGKPGPPRVRVVMGNQGGTPSSGDPDDEAANRFAPTPTIGSARHKPAVPRPAWVHGGRDWIIYLECRTDSLVLYPSQRTFPLAAVMSNTADNPLAKAIQQMIDRRQSLRRPGEPPYRPQLCLLVRSEHLRTYQTVYPVLEALPVPKTRRNLDADDDVIDIVNGASP